MPGKPRRVMLGMSIWRGRYSWTQYKMIQGSPKSEVGVLCQLDDFLHWDGMLAITPTSSHILDADTNMEN